METVKKSHFWCMLCSGYFELNKDKVHHCYLNEKYCLFQECDMQEYSVILFYCVYCLRITNNCLKVVCAERMDEDFPPDTDLALPYFCASLKCTLHLGFQTTFCPNHKNFKHALLYDYGSHTFIGNEGCLHCGAQDLEINTYYCTNNYKTQKLIKFLNNIPKKTLTRTKCASNLVRELQARYKNVSVFSSNLKALYN